MMTQKQNMVLGAELTAAHYDFEKGLNSYAFFKLNNHAIGEDLVQETFIKTWKYLVKGGKIELMKAFLYHVLNNLIVDQYRRRKMISLDSMIEKGFEPIGVSSDSGRLVNLLDGKAALLLIARLPLNYQQVMRMKYVQDLTLEEMALVTGKTKNLLAVQIHRGLEKLRILYTHQS